MIITKIGQFDRCLIFLFFLVSLRLVEMLAFIESELFFLKQLVPEYDVVTFLLNLLYIDRIDATFFPVESKTSCRTTPESFITMRENESCVACTRVLAHTLALEVSALYIVFVSCITYLRDLQLVNTASAMMKSIYRAMRNNPCLLPIIYFLI